jgi:hypothetical protein
MGQAIAFGAQPRIVRSLVQLCAQLTATLLLSLTRTRLVRAIAYAAARIAVSPRGLCPFRIAKEVTMTGLVMRKCRQGRERKRGRAHESQ